MRRRCRSRFCGRFAATILFLDAKEIWLYCDMSGSCPVSEAVHSDSALGEHTIGEISFCIVIIFDSIAFCRAMVSCHQIKAYTAARACRNGTIAVQELLLASWHYDVRSGFLTRMHWQKCYQIWWITAWLDGNSYCKTKDHARTSIAPKGMHPSNHLCLVLLQLLGGYTANPDWLSQVQVLEGTFWSICTAI